MDFIYKNLFALPNLRPYTKHKKRIILAIITGRISSSFFLLYYTPNSLCWRDGGPPYKNVVSKVGKSSRKLGVWTLWPPVVAPLVNMVSMICRDQVHEESVRRQSDEASTQRVFRLRAELSRHTGDVVQGQPATAAEWQSTDRGRRCRSPSDDQGRHGRWCSRLQHQRRQRW